MTAAPELLTADALRLQRDLAVTAAERGAPCTCASRSWQSGGVALLEHDGCWRHDPPARLAHLRIGRCECCAADAVLDHLDGGGWCIACQAEAGPAEGPLTHRPTLTEF